jgi:hypothetical protein
VSRRAVLTLYPNRVPEVGVPSENPNLTEPGVVLSGFVARFGDPAPFVAPDGSAHRADRLLVEALDAMVRTVSDASQVAIAVPAHWGPAALGALRAMLRTTPNLSPNGVPPTLVSDAVAALATLNTSPGLPHAGTVALLDFGGSGTKITLADAGSSGAEFAPIDETLYYTEFSGDQVDQALLGHVLADIQQSSGADTAAIGALTLLRDRSRQAKERLSTQTATDLIADLPGYHGEIRVTRAELENLISGPLTGVIGALEEVLQRNRIPTGVAAVATVGGGAAIPLITQRLSEHFRVPVVTTPQPALTAAAGAALFAARGPGADVPTGLAPSTAAESPTGVATAAWAAGGAGAATEADGRASATFRALAWSQEQGGEEPVPYSAADYANEPPPTSAGPQVLPPPEAPAAEVQLPWYRRPQVLFAAALLAVMVLGAGLVWTLTSQSSPIRSTRTSTATSPAVTNPQTPGAPLTQTVTITGTNGSPTVVTPPPSSTELTSSTTTSAPSTTTSTTQPTTTTQTTTTTQPPTTTTTQPPTTTTTEPPTTTQPPTTIPTQPPTTTINPPTSSAT